MGSVNRKQTTEYAIFLCDRQFCTKGVFRVYRISIAILPLAQQRSLDQYGNEILHNFFLLFCSLSMHNFMLFSRSIENEKVPYNIRF